MAQTNSVSLKQILKTPIIPGLITAVILLIPALIAAVILYFLFLYLDALYGGGVYSSKPSPDGKYVITYLRNSYEDGHAPYGEILVLSSEQVKTPEQGHVIFAGYCNDKLNYFWASNESINIKCNLRAIHTVSAMAYGITVTVEPAAPLNKALKAQPSAAGTPQSGAP